MAILLKMYFYTGTPRTFQSLSKLPLLCTQALGSIEILTQMPSRRRVGSPAANSGRRRETCSVGVWLGWPHIDWWWWPDRRWPRQAAAARSRRRARCGSDSGEARVGEGQCAAMGAWGWSSEGLGGFGRWREWAELWAHQRWRRWRIGGWRTHALVKRKTTFYSRARTQASLPRSDVTNALRRGVQRPSACVHSGRTDHAAGSARTPRGARAHRLRHAQVVRAGLTHAVLTCGLLGGAVVRRRTAVVQRRRVDARAWHRAGTFPPSIHGMCPCSFTRFSKNCK
jgi:hypothetical protein